MSAHKLTLRLARWLWIDLLLSAVPAVQATIQRGNVNDNTLLPAQAVPARDLRLRVHRHAVAGGAARGRRVRVSGAVVDALASAVQCLALP
jgi:hypothetical protein